jgi:hypothetical protein
VWVWFPCSESMCAGLAGTSEKMTCADGETACRWRSSKRKDCGGDGTSVSVNKFSSGTSRVVNVAGNIRHNNEQRQNQVVVKLVESSRANPENFVSQRH